MRRIFILLLGVTCLLSTADTFAQDVKIMYQSKLGVGNIDTVLVYMRSNKPAAQDISAVNLSLVYQNICLSVVGNSENIFLATWGFSLENIQTISITPRTYNGNLYNRRYQYGNSVIIGFFPLITLPDSFSAPMLVMKVAFNGTCTSLVYMEDEVENPFNQIADGTLVPIPYIIENILNQPLIASWRGFTTKKQTDGVRLAWRTQDLLGRHFEIEKSHERAFTDPITLGQVDVIDGGFGDRLYDFIDESNLRSIQYYRLKLIHLDGSHEYSPIIHLKETDVVPDITVYPNPTADLLIVRSTMVENPIQKVVLYDTNGKEVLQKGIADEPTYKLNIQHLAKGMYILEVLQASGNMTRSQVFKR